MNNVESESESIHCIDRLLQEPRFACAGVCCSHSIRRSKGGPWNARNADPHRCHYGCGTWPGVCADHWWPVLWGLPRLLHWACCTRSSGGRTYCTCKALSQTSHFALQASCILKHDWVWLQLEAAIKLIDCDHLSTLKKRRTSVFIIVSVLWLSCSKNTSQSG